MGPTFPCDPNTLWNKVDAGIELWRSDQPHIRSDQHAESKSRAVHTPILDFGGRAVDNFDCSAPYHPLFELSIGRIARMQSTRDIYMGTMCVIVAISNIV